MGPPEPVLTEFGFHFSVISRLKTADLHCGCRVMLPAVPGQLSPAHARHPMAHCHWSAGSHGPTAFGIYVFSCFAGPASLSPSCTDLAAFPPCLFKPIIGDLQRSRVAASEAQT